MKCPKISMLTGTACDLDEGHEGDHQRHYEGYRTIRWNDEADKRAVDQESRKKLGT